MIIPIQSADIISDVEMIIYSPMNSHARAFKRS
jgi:hypothetical protein